MHQLGFVAAIVGLSLGLSSCSSQSASEQAAPADSPSLTHNYGEHAEHAHDEHSDHAANGKSGRSDMNKMLAELAKLSPTDRASAEKQHLCPVSGEMLGMMGPPLKIDVSGQQVWICCENCKADLLAHPDEYLAKLKEGAPHE